MTEDFSFEEDFRRSLREYKQHLGTHLYLAATRYYQGDDNKYLYALSRLQVPLVVTNDVHYHHPERRELQDVVTCVREKCTIYNAGYRLHPNAERYLKPIPEMQRLFRHYQTRWKERRRLRTPASFACPNSNMNIRKRLLPKVEHRRKNWNTSPGKARIVTLERKYRRR
ncbi:hypothetical protein MKQ70_15435 [Chitinophaga sedimenti]|uniref:hypothetical protein n=1 Tax=Chitinophaga sedimenti TaxID=2033606 RepID=UPI0020037CCC|nr:hypothetical protein [Chitinophaga sedimenti]MCK7556332.1 hypothetical protein [Chitinophaga sedimenti]